MGIDLEGKAILTKKENKEECGGMFQGGFNNRVCKHERSAVGMLGRELDIRVVVIMIGVV